jgi:hypothetical protein
MEMQWIIPQPVQNRSAEAPAARSLELSPWFKIALACAMGLTVSTLGVSLSLLVFLEAFTPEAKLLFNTMMATWKVGFGAIVGLVGGKLSE